MLVESDDLVFPLAMNHSCCNRMQPHSSWLILVNVVRRIFTKIDIGIHDPGEILFLIGSNKKPTVEMNDYNQKFHVLPANINSAYRTVSIELYLEKGSNFMKFMNLGGSPSRVQCSVYGVKMETAAAANVVPQHSPGPKSSAQELDEDKDETHIPENLQNKEELRNIQPKFINYASNLILYQKHTIHWDEIGGLEKVKNFLKEVVVWPLQRPDFFKGLRGPPKAVLLFGPPGTGKTLLGKCIASQSNATFFPISPSCFGYDEGEKVMEALFSVARCLQPAVLFFDEIDSIFRQRSETEGENSRKVLTEFLTQCDGLRTETEERLLIVGATNRPQEIDEAVRRRFSKRVYVPLPDLHERKSILIKLMCSEKNKLTEEDFDIIGTRTKAFSCADLRSLCSEASLCVIRGEELDISKITEEQVRPINLNDFITALTKTKASVSETNLNFYRKWNEDYGSI